MKTYTIVYADLSGDIHTYTTPADSPDQAVCVFERDPEADGYSDLLHFIEHHVPRVTVVLDGDMVEAACSDGAVELLHVYADKESLGRAIENDQPVMPDSRTAMNYADKKEWAYAFNKVPVSHLPESVRFDHLYANDEEMIEEFTSAVRAEMEA